MARKAAPTPKLCERCDSFFPSIASATCPQCFGSLTALTEDQAVRAAEYQLERLKEPEYVEQKKADDDRFKEQSFGACLGVLAITILVVIASAVLIGLAAHKRAAAHTVALRGVSQGGDSHMLPLLPRTLGDLHQESFAQIKEPGMAATIYRGSYGSDIQVFAVSTVGLSSQDLTTFRLAVSLICDKSTPPLVSQEVHCRSTYYAVIGADGGLVGDASQHLVNMPAG